MKIIALIPAKKKSTRLHDKNIRLLNDIPLFGHAVLAALETHFFDNVIVLTNSAYIKDMAWRMGATPLHDPLAERTPEPHGGELALLVIEQLNLEDEDIIIYLQPTSPLRTSKHIKEARDLYLETCHQNGDVQKLRGKTVVSVTEVKQHPSWCVVENGHGFIRPHSRLVEKSQDLEKLYVFNGAIYITSVKQLRETGSFFNTEMVKYFMDYHESIDIDEEVDFFLAGALLKRREIQQKEGYFQVEKP